MNIAALAQRLEAARLEARLAELAPADIVSSVEDAYRIQTELARRAGSPVRGWKVTALAPADQKKYASSRPVAGMLFAPYVHDTPAEIRRSSLVTPLLECEVAFVLGADLPAQEAPYTQDQVEAAIAAVVPAFELADSRVGASAPDLLKLADAMGNGLFLAGTPVTDWRHLDLADISITLSHDGAETERGTSARILGNPLRAVVALANAQPLPFPGLRTGQIVTTGTCTTPIEIHPGKYAARFGPLGSMEMTVVA